MNQVTKLAKSPQGKKALEEAKRLAQDPKTKQQIEDVKERFMSKGRKLKP
jgi:hypothetical protein